MPAPTSPAQSGAFAIVWGIPATQYKVNGTAVGFKSNGQTLARAADKEETRDEQGEIVNITTYNQNETLTLTVYPTGTTKALAIADNLLLPYPGDIVAVIGTEDTKTHAADPGRPYRVDACEQARTSTAKSGFTLTLQRVAGITDYTLKT